MRAKIIGILGVTASLFFTAGCKDGQVFPDEPYLEYRSYVLIDASVDPDFPIDHAAVDLYFTDGDGDIGEEPIPTGDFNFFVNVFERNDSGEYVYAYDWNGILEDLSDPGQQNKVLEGIITYQVGLSSIDSDSAYIEFELIDDAGNTSGVIQSEHIFVDF
ncbi:MAG: hypothetical protein HWE14_06195 [Flavobacteriia bacterium]|nr:hypothetical protein [Flavobacteriia bacterium]